MLLANTRLRPTPRYVPGDEANSRRVRNAYAAEHSTCESPGCTKPVFDVHHIDGRHPSEPGANDWTNLQGLCRSHHRKITNDMKKARTLA